MNLNTGLLVQVFSRDRAGRNPHRGLACRRAAATTIVTDAVFLVIRVIGVAGTELVLDIAVVFRALILVFDQKTYRRACCLTLEHTGEDLHLVGLFPLRSMTRTTRPAAIEILLDIALIKRHSWRTTVDHAAERPSMALAERRHYKQTTETVTRHPVYPRDRLSSVRTHLTRHARTPAR